MQPVKMTESQTETLKGTEKMIETLSMKGMERMIMTGVTMRMATAQMKMTRTTVKISIFGK